MSDKKFFLLSPILWLRKIILYLLGIFILLSLSLYFIANSPWVIKKATDVFAIDYNITYSRIHGNFLTGVRIEDLAFNHKPLAEHISFKWNPNGLLKKQIIVDHAILAHVHVNTIEMLIDTFSSADNENSDTFDFSVYLKKVSIDTDPFTKENIHFKNITLEAKDIFYASNEIKVGNLGLVIDSNIANIMLKASLHKGIVEVNELNIQDLDTLMVEALVSRDRNTSTVADEGTNIFIPKQINLNTLDISILPVTYDPVDIESLALQMQKGVFDIQALVFKQGDIKLESETNLAKAVHLGHVKNNQLLGTLSVRAKEALFTKYDLPIRQASIEEIDIDLDASEERIIAKLDTQMSEVLKVEENEFNFDIDSLKSTLRYNFNDAKLKVNTDARVSTPYAKNIVLNNIFSLDENISYDGNVLISQIIGIDEKFVKPINDLKLQYSGDEKSINVMIDSAMLEGHLISDDFKMAKLHIASKEAIELRNFVELPTELNASKAIVRIDVPLNIESNGSYIAIAKIQSNVANIDLNVSYKDTLHVSSSLDVHQGSLLRPYSTDLKWDALMPMKIEAYLLNKELRVGLQAGSIDAKASYDFNTTAVTGVMHLGGLQADISGIAQKEIKIDSKITDITSLMKTISDIYTLDELPKVEGSATIALHVKELKKAELSLASPLVLYHADHKTIIELSDIDMLLNYEEENITLEHYKVTYEKEKIYASKPSVVTIVDELITLKPLWINDQLRADGSYDLKTRKAKVTAVAEKLHISHEMIDLDTNIDITTVLDENKTNVKGKVILLGGDVHYDLSQKSFASDSDIIIVEDIKEEKSSPFMDGLSVDVQVKTKKPLVYKKDAINIKANADVTVHKAEYSELLVLGSVEVLKGGTYIFEDKKFVLAKSFIHFTGNPNKPLLDIKVKYQSMNHIVTIGIGGSADLLHISFSSKPSLSREQILSLILFDTEAGAGTNSGDDMMRMMGGAMAKSALSSIGIKLDHLTLGEGNSVEVGKKLTNKITIIYVNDIVSKIKLKYRHGKRTESVISAGEESQSYDIIYKMDF